MANRLDKALQPGEKVLYRPHMSLSTFIKLWLGYTLFFAVGCYFMVWLIDFGKDGDELVSPMVVFGGSAAMSAYCLLLLGVLNPRQTLLLTDRRILWRKRPMARKVISWPLSEIEAVHGLANGCRLPLQVKTIDGKIESFGEKFFAQEFGLAMLKAAGVSLSDDPHSATERVAGLVHKAQNLGISVGLVGILIGISYMNQIGPFYDLDLLSKFLIVIFASIAFMVVSFIVITFGRIVGPILVIGFKRQNVAVEEMRGALSLLVSRGLLLGANDDCCRFHPLIFRFASWIYGEPMIAEQVAD